MLQPLKDRLMSTASATGPEPERSAESPKLEVLGSRQFTAWLAEQRVSLAFTTYQAGKLFLLGQRRYRALGSDRGSGARTLRRGGLARRGSADGIGFQDG